MKASRSQPGPSLLAVLLLASTVVPAGQGRGGQPRDTAAAPQAQGTASISGVVLVADTGRPARRTRVTLSGPELRGGRNTITDNLGRFVFSGLPAGRFTVNASKAGHIPVSYGQRPPGTGRPGTPITVVDNQRVEVQLHLPRGAVITGTVLDEQGEAVPGTPVRVMRYVLQNGERTLHSAGNGSTDDRGIYRIYGLQPGEYMVAAVPRNAMAAMAMAGVEAELQAALQQRGADQAGMEMARAREMMAQRLGPLWASADPEATSAGYAPVYYPGTTSPASAATVMLGMGEEKAGVDFQLQLVPVARIEGVVVTGTGPAVQNVRVTLVNLGASVPGLPGSGTRPDAEGRFRLTNVAPGQYMLVARGTVGGGGRGGRAGLAMLERPGRGRGAAEAGATRLWAMIDLAVDGQDISNIVLTLQPGMSVSGRIAFDGTTLQPPADPTRIRVNVTPVTTSPAERQLASGANGNADASGRFTIDGLSPGRYRITASGAGGGWVVASSIVAGQDTLDFPVEVRPGQNVSNVVVTLTDRVTELSGVIIDGQSQPAPDYTIVVYPADRTFWMPQSRRIRSTRPATDGRYTFRSLPPGDYRIAPVLDPEPGSWFDPGWLQQLDAGALRFSLNDGEKKVQNLRIGPGA